MPPEPDMPPPEPPEAEEPPLPPVEESSLPPQPPNESPATPSATAVPIRIPTARAMSLPRSIRVTRRCVTSPIVTPRPPILQPTRS